MMEAEASAPLSAPPREVAPAAEPDEVDRLLLMARQLIYEGKPTHALEVVVFCPCLLSFALFFCFFLLILNASGSSSAAVCDCICDQF